MTIDRKSLGTQTFSEDSDLSKASYLEMGNQELVLAPPTTTQYFLNEEPQVREYFLDETARALAAWSCLDTFPRKYLPLIFEPPFGDSQSSSRSESSTLSYQRDFPEPGSDSDFESPSIPPSPSNPAALNKTWEQVRANNSKGSKPADTLSPKLKALAKAQEKKKQALEKAQERKKIHRDWVRSKLIKSYPPTITEEEALRLRGGRIEWELNSFAGKLWKNLYETANRKLGEDSSLQEQLQSDNLWLSPETKDEGSRIEAWMEYLERRHWYVEAEWKCSFWLIDFFRGLNSNLTRSQLHTFNLENSSLENRCPPIITNTETIVAASKTPYDADPNRQESGFAFSDVSYAVCMDKEVSHQDLVIIKLLPTIRLYDSTHWYMAGVIVEVKPLKIEKECYTDIYWSTTEVYQFSVRYLTLTAMTMLQEYLKLCYMSSPDPTFFPEPDQLIIHLLIAVGHTVWHYIHTIGDGAVGEPIKYVSYCLGTFNMKEARERDQFRDRLNKILVLQVTTFKEAMESKVREVLALGPAEIKRRLESRAHQGVRFSHSVREDGVWGFSVEHSSPTQETKSLLKPDPSPRTIPEDKEAKLEQENRNRENAHLPSSSHPTTRSMTSATIKAQGRKGNKDGGAAALPSHTSTLEEDAQPGGGETSKRRSTTPDVGDARTQGKRGRGIGGGLGRGVGRSGGQAVTASQVTQREEVKGTTRGVGATRGGDVRAPRGGRGRRRGGPPAPT